MATTISDQVPRIRTCFLNAAQEALCEQNPTYFAQLAQLKALQRELERTRSTLRQECPKTVAGDIMFDRTAGELMILEQKFRGWDDELASLAEALLGKPKFRCDAEVECIDGKWRWTLPSSAITLPKHAMATAMTHPYTPAASPSRRLSNRLTKLMKMRTGGAQRLKRSVSAI